MVYTVINPEGILKGCYSSYQEAKDNASPIDKVELIPENIEEEDELNGYLYLGHECWPDDHDEYDPYDPDAFLDDEII